MSSSTVFPPVSTTKRNRTSSQSSGSSIGSRQHVANKSTRISSPLQEGSGGGGTSSSTTHPLLCTLPPTCNHKPTPLASTKELESHYATYHAHVCEQPDCGSVFPDARLLELHQTENHDPLAALRKDRGEKIFACHLPSCPRLFANPKGRRLHLISAHAYPKEYFFAVTNKGVGGLLKKWGEGASMVRGKWTPREPVINSTSKPQLPVDKETMRDSTTSSSTTMDIDDDSDDDQPFVEDDDDDSDLEEQYTKPQNTVPPTSRSGPAKPVASRNKMMLDDPEATPRPTNPSNLPPVHDLPALKSGTPTSSANTADSLAAGLSTLSLVPASVRFGRGGRGGFSGHHAPTPGAGHLDKQAQGNQPPAHGQAARNSEGTQATHTLRGRGGFHARGAPRARGSGRGRGGRGG